MRCLFIGDVVGKAGRDAVQTHLPGLRQALGLDLVVINGENAAHGFGIVESNVTELFAAGADCITTGNHIWSKKEVIPYLEREARLLRPINFPEGTPGRGASIITTGTGKRALVINAMGRIFMEPLDDPFMAVDRLLKQHKLGSNLSAIILDFHAEATSEKMAMAHFCDGRVSLVVGTHTHIPTADAQILPGGTAYQSDAGMCGDFDSVIGMQKQPVVQKFVRKMPTDRMIPAEGEGTLCGVFVETDDKTGLATRIEPVRIGGRLASHIPSIDA